ncbi:MAG TPA: lysylphosphatidylglycerol synthase transmembrane domain-containing protein [Phycisphaerae bacterium]|nr:lysylphosphatidylglycerol synthase transmembrane domain-containing protein [Phycisphaerae bacterium]
MSSSARKWISRLVKLAFCGGALWYLSGKVTLNDYARLAENPEKRYLLLHRDSSSLELEDRDTGRRFTVPFSALAPREKNRRAIEPGLKSTFSSADHAWALWGLLLYGPVTFLISWRLQCMLATQDISLGYRDATLLTFAGNFFNFAMPGTTGGDIYKAYHIARRTHKRTEGVTIVLLDRAIGLASFLILGAATIMISWKKDMIGEYGRWVGYLMVALMVGSVLFFSNRVRRWIRYERLLERLPFADKIKRIDQTTFSFRRHRGQAILSLAITLVAHFLFVGSIFCMARSFGIQPHGEQTESELFLAVLLASVVGYLFAAIPITIQGFGLLEAVFIRVLVNGGWCNESQMLALTLSARLIQMIWSMPGVIVPWLGFSRPHVDDIEMAATQGAS